MRPKMMDLRFMLKLIPDKDISVNHTKIAGIPTLILRPKNWAPNAPGLLWIHGGGYILGFKEMVFMGRAANLVKRFGITVFSPGYRLAWQKPYPAAVDDCYAVLQYMDANRKELGIKGIMVGGESAGGGLAAGLCMMARDQGIQVDYQFPLYPMLSNLDTDSSINNHGKVWNTRRNHLGWNMYLRRDAKRKVHPYASPAQQTDYSNLPPCYTFVGDGEPFYSETLTFVQNLRNAGVEADVDIYHTDTHAFDMLNPQDEISRQAIMAFEAKAEKAIQNIKSLYQ